MTDDRRDPPRDKRPLPAKPVPASPAPGQPVPARPVPVRPVPAQAVPAKPVAAQPVRAKPPAGKPSAAAASPARPPAPPDPYVGKTIGRCKILARIGQGRTATVYRAHHEGLGTDVAVKILLPEIVQHASVVAKFEAEARAIARLDHPNVLKIYDVVGEGDARGIVMELLEGEDVLEYLNAEGGKVDPQDALRIVRQAAAGLRAAHGKGIIHRDVKPQNLVILEDGTVKLVDFGLATQADGNLTAERIGTPHYMAPEVCEAKPVEPSSDVYSLGISLHHLLTGTPPYAGQSVKEILASHVAGKPLEPERAVRGLVPALADLVRAMTKRDPLTRASIDDVLATIDRIGGDALVKEVRLKPRKARHHRLAAGRARARKGPGAVLLAVGAAVLVGLVVALTQTGKGQGDAPTPVPPRGPAPVAAVDGPTPPASTQGPASPDAPSAEPAVKKPNPEVETAREIARRQAAEAAAKLKEMEDGFAAIEAFARANEEDVSSVAHRYRVFSRAYPVSDLGKEARRRADGIAKGELHPHPDKKFAEKSEIERAREAWSQLQTALDEAVETKRYDEALRLVPARVEDPDRKLTAELETWRSLLTVLSGFFATLEREVATVPAADRVVETPQGRGPIVRFAASGPTVKLASGPVELRWSDVTAASVADLAGRAFTGEGKSEELKIPLAAFAWAHKLKDTFYGAAIAVAGVRTTGPGADLVSKLLQRRARFEK